MNQQIENQISESNSKTAKIPPAQRVYAFRDLPKNSQEKLLRLQNSDGDFLRLSNSVTASRIILLILLAFGSAFFLAAFENAAFDWKVILIFVVGALIFASGFLYLFWRLFKTMRSPVKNQIFLTPTQVIETTDGRIRFRQLKDAAEISVNRYWSDIGKRSTLEIKFADGDLYGYRMETNNNSAQFAETEKWCERAQIWKDKAVGTFEKGDAIYFDLPDDNQNAAANLPV